MLRRWVLAVFLALTASFICTTSSAATLPKLQTRVGGFDVAAQTLVGPAAARSLGNRRAKSLTMYKCASDPRLGVYDTRARWWSPRLGAFVQADKFAYIDPTSTLWGWPGANPMRWSDTSGHDRAPAGFGVGIFSPANVQTSFAASAFFADATSADFGAGNFVSGVGDAVLAAATGLAGAAEEVLERHALGPLDMVGMAAPMMAVGGEVGEASCSALGPMTQAEDAASQIASAPRSGTALVKSDPMHRAASFADQATLSSGQAFDLQGGDGVMRTLLQAPGEVNSQPGIFEYILDPNGSVTHQRFIPGGTITGTPNQ